VRTLFLTPQPPFPAHQGTAIRNWGLLRHLAAHEAVSLLSFAPSDFGPPAAELSAVCQSLEFVPHPARGAPARLRSLLNGRADMSERLASPAFDLALRRRLAAQHFDLIQIEGLELGRYLATIRASAPGTPVVYDAHNAEVAIQQRAWQNDRRQPRRWPVAAYSRLQVPRIARFEAELCRQAEAVTCVSAVDAAALRHGQPALQPVVVANGIDLADYPLAPPVANSTLVFTGKMDYRPNIDAALWFAREILPRVRRAQPAARLAIVGQKPVPALAALAGQEGIDVLGGVPDIRPHIADSAVYVAPLRMGGGTRFKLLEAMALGRPIVSTTIGAEGFDVQSGRELLLADSPEALADCVLKILADPALAARLVSQARSFVAAYYDWAAIIPNLLGLHQSLVAKQRAK
jgi:glycosyltransferase involved in cell wall biosynthesis